MTKNLLTPPRRLSSYDDGEENAAHPHTMICRLRQNACIEERCQKGKEDLSQASFKYTHFAVAGKSSYEDEWRSLRHHHMMISDAEGLRPSSLVMRPGFMVTTQKTSFNPHNGSIQNHHGQKKLGKFAAM